MQLQFSTRHIAFALSTIWQTTNLYKFKYAVNEQITANPDLDYMHTLDVPEDVLIRIFSAVTVEPEGVASIINAEMEDLLMQQIQPLANLAAVQAGTEEPNEGARALIAISKISEANKTILESKVQAGLAQILA